MIKTTEKSSSNTHLLNGTISSMASIIPIPIELQESHPHGSKVIFEFGVLIGITGGMKGKMLLTGESKVFGAVGAKMFGMPLEGEMLSSFCGELGNMIAGGMATHLSEQGIGIDITSPTLLEGQTTLTGYENALQVPVRLENTGEIKVYLLQDA
jgi:chemotaxis protein CheX